MLGLLNVRLLSFPAFSGNISVFKSTDLRPPPLYKDKGPTGSPGHLFYFILKIVQKDICQEGEGKENRKRWKWIFRIQTLRMSDRMWCLPETEDIAGKTRLPSIRRSHVSLMTTLTFLCIILLLKNPPIHLCNTFTHESGNKKGLEAKCGFCWEVNYRLSQGFP